MTCKRSLAILLAMAAALLLPALPGRAAGQPDTSKMNVLFIIAEDWNASTPGCYGNTICKTPNLDRFATTAVRFDRAYVQGIACNPSRSSFLSGLRPLSSGVWNNGQVMSERLPAGAVTLPELFKARGFTTAVIGKFFHHIEYAEKQLLAFDRIESYEKPAGWNGPGPIMTFPPAVRSANAAKSNITDPAQVQGEGQQKKGKKKGQGGGKKNAQAQGAAKKKKAQQNPLLKKMNSDRYGDSGFKLEDESDYRNAQIAAALINEFAKEKKQFFLSVHSSRPHTPFVAPKQFLDMYDPDKIPDPPAPLASLTENLYPRRVVSNPDIFTTHQPTARQAKEAIAAYYACVSMVDHNIGMILDALDKAGLADNTIVFIMGDHGIHLGDHGYWSKYSMLESTRRAPLWVCVPGAAGNGQVCREFVEFVDFMPTLGELVGLKVPANVEGLSFAPLLAKPETPWKKAVFQVETPENQVVRTKQFSYMEFGNGPVPVALYDMEKDPWETRNLANDPAYAKTRQEMAALLKAGWKAALPEGKRPEGKGVEVK